ncbi:hypothetical protein QZH41_011272, partial [Actinostola sp. cb2023]
MPPKRRKNEQSASIASFFPKVPRQEDKQAEATASGSLVETVESTPVDDSAEVGTSSAAETLTLVETLPVRHAEVNTVTGNDFNIPGTEDIGKYIDGSMTNQAVDNAMKSMSRGKKYELLTQHSCPSQHHKFPQSFDNGCYRSFRFDYFKNRPWLVYSQHLDAAFCIVCALFANDRSNKHSLVTKPFKKWARYTTVIVEHAEKAYHRDAMSAAQAFKESIENPTSTVSCLFDKERDQHIRENREILKAIAKAVLYCGRQCIALRGDKEKLDQPGNPGNFLALLKLMAEKDHLLHEHLNPNRRVTYLSPQSQNEMIQVIGKHFIQRKIVQEIKDAKYYSILADEATSHNEEKLTIVMKFVNSQKEICEEFLEFKKLERTSGVAISTALLDTLRDLNIPIEDCRGQGYDGAASMSSQRVGVQAEIRNHGAPKAIYIHCAGHCLNLVVVHACALTAVKNMIDKVKQVCIYFNYSPKRNGLLAAIIEDQHPENTRKKPLLTLCTTRWAERAESYDHFYEAFKYIVFTLEIIAHNLHYDECPDQYKDGWRPSSRKDASGLLQAITTFDFIITFVCAHITLSHMTGLTVKLQKKTNDIFKAFTMVSDIQNTYIPRVAVRQQHRANAPAASPKDYYRINLGVPFLDHIISQLDERFSSITVKSTQLLGLVPSVIQQMQ